MSTPTDETLQPHQPPPTQPESRGNRFVDRKLNHYPVTSRRFLYLGITVLATVILYYELYIGGAVSTKIIADLGFTFTGYVFVSVIGNLVGAFASLAAGFADRWGRANLVVIGLFITGLIILLWLPNATSTTSFIIGFAILSVVEGVVLVATPALIRDFSPQLGRASAMGFWTLGPVLGSLVVTVVSSATLDAHPDWQFQFKICGVVGLVVAVIAFVTLRELSPQLRDQLMVSLNDRVLIEARAKDIDLEEVSKNPWRQVLRFDVIGSAFAISVFLLLYYILVGFFVLYMALVFGYSAARANGLANWYWACNALALVVTGFLSDKTRVRKPFMILGGLISMIGCAFFAVRATAGGQPSYASWVILLIVMSVGGGMAYTAWMASFTETVEKHNPAATATGLAVWGWIIRIVVTVSLFVFGFALPAVDTLVSQGAQVSAIAAKYPEQLKTIGALKPDTLAALQANPTSPIAGAEAVKELVTSGVASGPAAAVGRLQQLGTNPIAPKDAAYLAKNAPAVQQAVKDNPGQWERWWWVCFAGQVVFLPFVFIMTGRWSPKKAREDAERHEAAVRDEMAKLHLTNESVV